MINKRQGIFTGHPGQPLRHFSGSLVFLLAGGQWTSVKIEPKQEICQFLRTALPMIVLITLQEKFAFWSLVLSGISKLMQSLDSEMSHVQDAGSHTYFVPSQRPVNQFRHFIILL